MPAQFKKNNLDDYWNVRSKDRAIVAVALYRLFDEVTDAHPAELESATTSEVIKVPLKTITYLRDRGEKLHHNYPTLSAILAGQFRAPAMTPFRKFQAIAGGLLTHAAAKNPADQSVELRELIAHIELIYKGAKALESKSDIELAEAAHAPEPPESQEPHRTKAVVAPIRTDNERMERARTAIEFLLEEGQYDRKQVGNVYAAFTGALRGKTPPLEIYYNCYRFHSSSHKIVKSFMVVKPSNPLVPVTLFTNVWKANEDDLDPRISRGIVLPGGENLIYFLGSIQESQSLKVMAMHRPRSARDTYVGVGLSVDEDGQAIAARFLLKKTDATSDDEAEVGELGIEDAIDEIGVENLNKIRNRIHFVLEPNQKVKRKNKPVAAANLTAEVFAALHDGDGPVFTIGENEGVEAFNPADERFFTYNSALKIWDRSERR